MELAELDSFKTGLRSQDVHAGLRNVDPNSGSVVQYMEATRVVGMAASLAMAIKGHDVIQDAEALKVIAADQLDIDGFAFNEVVRLLQDMGFISNVREKGGRIETFYENVPLHRSVFEQLGKAWEHKSPTEIEASMLLVVDTLATQPVRQSELVGRLGLEENARNLVLTLGRSSDLVKAVVMSDGDQILYSPYYSFENPGILAELFDKFGSDEIQEEFQKLKQYQGIPVSDHLPVLLDATARGLIAAASVEGPGGDVKSFGFAPYTIEEDYLTTRKSILDRAMAILACVRCGQHFGGVTSVRHPSLILDALLDSSRDRMLKPHSSHRRQYRLLHRMGIVRFVRSASWDRPQLIDSEENIEAVRLAKQLLIYSGEPLDQRGVPSEASQLLVNQGRYLPPVMTVKRQRDRLYLSDSEWEKLIDAASGRARIGD